MYKKYNESFGIIIEGFYSSNINDIDKELIKREFEKNGVILFRGFDFNKDSLIQYIDSFTLKYVNDAVRREKRFGSTKIRDVDVGCDEHTLHCEGSYTPPACPEIIWFFCNEPPERDGETILCDGIELWEQ